MGSVWKRLNRINKRASKFHFTASYSELWLEAGPNWQPTALSVVWTRKSRRVISDPVKWEPTMKNPYQGMCVWPVPENKEITVTMFRDPNKDDYENKDWFFMLEDVTSNGKRKPVAQGRLNMREFSTAIPSQHNLTVKLRPISKKVTSARLTLTLTAELIREGKATDEDMRSIASLVSNSTMNDLERMNEVEEEDHEVSSSVRKAAKDEISSITKQVEEMNKTTWDRSLELVPGQEILPVRTVVQSPTVSYPARINVSKENKTVKVAEEKEIVSPRVVDLNLKSENKNRGFGSREWKSTYNGPIGNYTVASSPPPNIDHEDDTASLIPKKDDHISPAKSIKIISSGDHSLGKEKGMEQINKLGEKKEVEEVFKANKPSKIVESVDQSVADDMEIPKERNIIEVKKEITDEIKLVEEQVEVVEELNKSKEKDETVEDISNSKEETAKVCNVAEVTKETKTVEKLNGSIEGTVQDSIDIRPESNNISYQRTKSQEFRDYQQEFVLSSTIDLGPLSSPALQRRQIPDVNNKTPRKNIDQTLKSKSPSVKSFEIDRPSSESLSPEKPISSSQKSSPHEESSRKTEITPSPSFLSNLADNSSGSEVTSPTSELPKLQSPIVPKERTLIRQNTGGASTDLLDWAKSICVSYPTIKVTNFTTSWRNGMAFCALIHSFYSDLIPYDTLTAHDIKYNCKLAFEAGEKLGIPRVMEPESMVIKRIPDKLAVITYLHQLRSCLGTEETKLLYEKSMEEQQMPNVGVRKSFSDGNIRLFSRSCSNETDKSVSDLPTIEESPNVDIKPEKITEYRARAKTIVQQNRSDDGPDQMAVEGNGSSTPKVILRQKNSAPNKGKKDNRLSYIDNEMKVLDAEQIEIDRQAAILDKRLRETSEDDQLMYDGLLQQWFTLVNKKNDLLRRQMTLNILEKEDDLEKKLTMLQEELRTLSEMDDRRKTEDDVRRENLLLEELVLVVNQRNQLVIQRDEEERMIEQDEALDKEVTKPENEHLRNNKRDECRMQ